MESFSLLKYWRAAAAAAATAGGGAPAVSTIRATASISPPPEPLHQDSDDEGPFFDLHFTIPHENDFTLSMTSSDESESQSPENLPISPSDDLFFKRRIFTAAETDLRPQVTDSFIKSATRFRIFMPRLRKPKSPIAAADVPSLFSRESSCRNLEERGSNSREVVQKYLGKIKPLYVRVSKRYSEKLRFSAGEAWEGEDDESEMSLKTGEKRRKAAVSSRIRVVYKHFRKRKMATLAAVGSPAVVASRRKDDSFLEQQDGIQSAIAHCKRSLRSSSKDSVF